MNACGWILSKAVLRIVLKSEDGEQNHDGGYLFQK